MTSTCWPSSRRSVAAPAEVVGATTDWGESGRRPGQYRVDLDVDDVCVGPLLAAGCRCSRRRAACSTRRAGRRRWGSSWSIRSTVRPMQSLGLPWFATSLCLVVDGEPTVSMVSNLVTGAQYTAVRGSWRPIERRGHQGVAGAGRWMMRSSRSVGCPIIVRLAAVPGDGCICARHLCRGERILRRVRRHEPRCPRRLGLPRGTVGRARRPGEWWSMPWGVISSCSITTPVAHRWRRRTNHSSAICSAIVSRRAGSRRR